MKLLEMLENQGISLDSMVDSAMELFVPHEGLETVEGAGEVFREILLRSLEDVNVSSLVLAGLLLDGEGGKGRIPGLGKGDFENDAVHILADEILGLAIAEYIGGTRARFEYVRYDMKKPGILGKLGPFTDDVICGLIAGTSSQMYTGALG